MNSQGNLDYYILSLSKKKVSLFKLHDTATEEIQDGIFPMFFSEEDEYAESRRSASYGSAIKNFEKEKSMVKKEKFTQFLRSVNEELGRYLDGESALLLAGTREDRGAFKRVSVYNDLIGGEISGSFNSSNINQLKHSIQEPFRNKSYGIRNSNKLGEKL
jgi:hypothetical protein